MKNTKQAISVRHWMALVQWVLSLILLGSSYGEAPRFGNSSRRNVHLTIVLESTIRDLNLNLSAQIISWFYSDSTWFYPTLQALSLPNPDQISKSNMNDFYLSLNIVLYRLFFI